MSKWQLWTLCFHIIAIKEGLDCVAIGSEEAKSQDQKKEAMIMKTRLPPTWHEENRVAAKMTYVHASDTTRFFIFTFQERQGNRIEVKL